LLVATERPHRVTMSYERLGGVDGISLDTTYTW
jgi:hypothetical protein